MRKTAAGFVLAALTLAAPLRNAAADAPARAGITVVLEPAAAGDLTGHLRNETNLVHGLVKDRATVDTLNAGLRAAGKTGRITVGVWDGTCIPFVADTVNVVVAADAQVTDEMRRALAPYGVAVDRAGKTLWRKPYPEDTDEWTHYRYAPHGNGVSRDRRVGPSRHIKWLAGPQMLRHHDHLPSLSAMVSAGGRVFYIFDEAPCASILFPPEWHLIARDAYNGVGLWKQRIPEWHPHLWPLKSMPAALPRRLVAVDDRVYATLGIKAPVTQFNAVDGAVTRVFAGSEKCEEIVVSDDTLLAVCLRDRGPLDDMDAERGSTGKDGRATGFPYLNNLMGSNKSPLWLNAKRRLIACDIVSGKERWHADGTFAPLSTATDGKRVYYHNGKALEALDIKTGEKRWTSEPVPIWEAFYACYGTSLLVHDGVVIFSGGENYDWQPPGTKKGAEDTMTAVSAEDGRKLWSAPHPSSGYRSPEDLHVAQGLVWAPDTMKKGTSTLNGLDPRTGKVVRTVALDLQHGFHHRCHASRATETYLLASKVGINFIRFDGKGIVNDHWVRGACGFGIVPANGLIYATPDPCNCFPESKLNGFAALAQADPALAAARQKSAGAIKTETGETFAGRLPAALDNSAWPTYRADSARSASTPNAPPGSFKPAWKAEIGGRISAPVVAGGRVFLASIDRNQVIAIDIGSGRPAWTHVAGGPVDSPPTVVGPLLFFGAADGTVTALKADSGGLVWRRRLAPTDEKIVDDGRIESVWPVHGSVTYHHGLIYAAAGRNMYVDGGLTLGALDPATGALKHSATHSPEFQPGGSMNTIPSKTDILSASGPHLFMRSLAYDGECNIVGSTIRHIYSVNGYLNDTWFHRSFWTYSTAYKGGCGGFGSTGNGNHSGRIMASDDSALYAFGRDRYGWGSAFTYQLYKAPLTAEASAPAPAAQKGKKAKKGKGGGSGKGARAWSVDIPVLPRSLVRAGDRLLVTGPERLYDENAMIQKLPDPAARAMIADQARRWETKADLLVVDPADGRVLEKARLDFAPVWDGVAVAERSLFISGTDGALYRLK